jgi:hypothetical protein
MHGLPIMRDTIAAVPLTLLLAATDHTPPPDGGYSTLQPPQCETDVTQSAAVETDR